MFREETLEMKRDKFRLEGVVEKLERLGIFDLAAEVQAVINSSDRLISGALEIDFSVDDFDTSKPFEVFS